MGASLVAWRRTAVAAFAVASLSGVSLEPANAQDASEEMQRAKAALSAALRDRVAAEQKRAETPAPAGAPAPASVQAQPAAAAPAAVAQAEPALATPRPRRPEARERRASKAVARVAPQRAPARQTRIARHRSRVQVAAAEERATMPRQEVAHPASTGTADFPATTGSLSAQPAKSAAALMPSAASMALPASLAPAMPTLGSNELSVYREGLGWMRGTQAALNAMQQPLTGARGARPEIVAACREAIVPAAVARGATEIYAAGTARARKAGAGRMAPIEVRILYKGMATTEVRQASVTCELDREGQVIALSDTGAHPGSP
ncbi:MAG TPA: hypothetical protein VKA39_10020 [Beijerinckiaceae bacterium]|nr:hypothetical protein [Beijerinckiaceae bacterium]